MPDEKANATNSSVSAYAEASEASAYSEASPAVQTEVPAAEAPASGDAYTPAPKKKMKLWLKLVLFIGVPLIIIAALAAVNFRFLLGLFLKTFAPDVYMASVEKTAIQDGLDAFIPGYGSMLEQSDSTETVPNSFEAKMDLSGLNNSYGYGMSDSDLSWLKDVTVKYISTDSDGSTGTEALIYIGDTPVLTVKEVVDKESGEKYLTIPELSGDPVKAYENNDSSAYSDNDTEMLKDFVASLPEAEVLKGLADKYSAILMNGIKNVQVSSGTVTVGSEEVRCTELRLEMDNEAAGKLMEELLTEVKKDEDIKKIITDFVGAVAQAYSLTNEYADIIDPDKTYREFIDAVDELLVEARNMQKGDEKNDTYLILTDYVTAKHKLIGRKIEDAGNGEFIFAAKAEKKGEAVYEFNYNDETCFEATVKEDKNTVSADFTLTKDGSTVLSGEISGTNPKAVKNSDDLSFKAKLDFEDDSAIIDDDLEFDSTYLGSGTVEISYEINDGGLKFGLSAYNADRTIFDIAVDCKSEETSAETDIPDSYLYYDPDADDYTDIVEWFNTLDYDAFAENMQKAGVSEEMTVYIEYLIFYKLEYYVFGEDYYYFNDEDDYYDDYYYDDDYYYGDDYYYDDDYYYGDDYYYDDDYFDEYTDDYVKSDASALYSA